MTDLRKELDEVNINFNAYKNRAQTALKRLGVDDRNERQKEQEDLLVIEDFKDRILDLESQIIKTKEELNIAKSINFDNQEITDMNNAMINDLKINLNDRQLIIYDLEIELNNLKLKIDNKMNNIDENDSRGKKINPGVPKVSVEISPNKSEKESIFLNENVNESEIKSKNENENRIITSYSNELNFEKINIDNELIDNEENIFEINIIKKKEKKSPFIPLKTEIIHDIIDKSEKSEKSEKIEKFNEKSPRSISKGVGKSLLYQQVGTIYV